MKCTIYLIQVVLVAAFCLFCSFRLYAQNSTYSISTTKSKEFVPAEEILFYDDFLDCDTGQVPINWEIKTVRSSWRTLEKSIEGAAVKKIRDISVLRIPEGYCEYLSPLIKSTICDTCYTTLEFDYFHIIDSQKKVTLHINYNWGPVGWENACIAISNNGKINIGYMHNKTSAEDQDMMYKIFNFNGNYEVSKWHHFAASFYRKNMTLYIDDDLIYRQVYIHLSPLTFNFMYPYYVTNVRIAQTKGKNTLDKIFEDNKLIMHAIKFDTKESVIKLEYTGFIKQVAEWLTKNKTVSLEIVGYTDNEGNEKDNLILSKERAIAIKTMLVKYGVAENRIASKGCGAANPIGKNDTPESRANNRRIEFVRK